MINRYCHEETFARVSYNYLNELYYNKREQDNEYGRNNIIIVYYKTNSTKKLDTNKIRIMYL